MLKKLLSLVRNVQAWLWRQMYEYCVSTLDCYIMYRVKIHYVLYCIVWFPFQTYLMVTNIFSLWPQVNLLDYTLVLDVVFNSMPIGRYSRQPILMIGDRVLVTLFNDGGIYNIALH